MSKKELEWWLGAGRVDVEEWVSDARCQIEAPTGQIIRGGVILSAADRESRGWKLKLDLLFPHHSFHLNLVNLLRWDHHQSCLLNWPPFLTRIFQMQGGVNSGAGRWRSHRSWRGPTLPAHPPPTSEKTGSRRPPRHPRHTPFDTSRHPSCHCEEEKWRGFVINMRHWF